MNHLDLLVDDIDVGPRRDPWTDVGNALRLVTSYEHALRFVPEFNSYFAWKDRRRWVRDVANEAQELAKASAIAIKREEAADPAKRDAWARQSASAARIAAVLRLASSDPRIAVSQDQLDADPWLLNVRNGTIDLRTAELHPHRREDLITRLVDIEYSPDATAPSWDRYLCDVQPSQEMRAYLAQIVGYCLTGSVDEKCIFINHGPGQSGKTVFSRTVGWLLGDYAASTPTSTFVNRSHNIPNDLAALRGCRLVTMSETQDGEELAVSLVKQVTGGDPINARFMRAEWFSFLPSFKVMLSTNSAPSVRASDDATWRRLKRVPFERVIPDHAAVPLEEMLDRLRAEGPGILSWAVRGCLAWQRDRHLAEPMEVTTATAEYRVEEDVVGRWIEECCDQSPALEATASDLYASYRSWADREGIPKYQFLTNNLFGRQLKAKGFTDRRGTGGKKMRRGIQPRIHAPVGL